MRGIVLQVRRYFYLLVKSKAIFFILIVALFLLTIAVKDIVEKTLLQ